MNPTASPPQTIPASWPVIRLPVLRATNSRLRLTATCRRLVGARSETHTAFLLRALAREVLRCQAELANSPLAEQLSAQDRDELAALALLSEDERKRYGL